MKFKVIYEYFEIIDADYFEPDCEAIRFVSFEPDCETIRFVSDENANHWIPKYMIKRIVPLKDEDNGSSR